MNIPTLTFLLQEKKLKKDGNAPIYLRITINGTRSEVSTKVDIAPSKWDSKKELIKGKEPLTIRLNQELQNFKLKVYDVLEQVKIQRYDITANNLKLGLSGELFQNHTLKQVYALFIENLENRVGTNYSPASLEINKTTYDHLIEFLDQEGKAQLKPEEFNNQQFLKFENFLKSKKQNSHNTVYKKIERVKAVFKWAYEMDYIEKDHSKKFKIKKQKKEIIFLTQEELDRLKAVKPIERLAIIRDAFLFICYTGLAFNEIERLSEENLSKNIAGGYGIIMTRQKTSRNIPEIPLLPMALDLISKYKNHPKRILEKKLFPIPANQNFNGYLKELAALANIDKPVSAHTARKTFATTIGLRNGMSMEVVSKALGHSNIRITQESYADLQNDRIREEFEKLEKNLNSHESNKSRPSKSIG
jgi:site-specific recombinase XerD